MKSPQALQELDLDGLVGRSVESARSSVEQAGGVLRAIAPDGAITLDLRTNRVTVIVEDGRVTRVHGRG